MEHAAKAAAVSNHATNGSNAPVNIWTLLRDLQGNSKVPVNKEELIPLFQKLSENPNDAEASDKIITILTKSLAG